MINKVLYVQKKLIIKIYVVLKNNNKIQDNKGKIVIKEVGEVSGRGGDYFS